MMRLSYFYYFRAMSGLFDYILLLLVALLGLEFSWSALSHYSLKDCKHGKFILNDYDVDISMHMNLYGEWAEQELQLFKSILKVDDIVIDAGANIGAFTIPLARLVGPTGHVHAFEPQKIINQRLNANIVLNELENVDVYLAALGNSTGKIAVPMLNYSTASNFGALSLTKPIENQSDRWAYEVPLMTLDSVNFYNPFTGRDCPALIKMDVEMMEKYVLQGAPALIQRCRPVIHTENNAKQTTAGLVQQLYELNYVPFWDIKTAFNPNNFNNVTEDITKGYHNINMINIPKEKLSSEGGNIAMIGYTTVEKDRPFVDDYFLQQFPDGSIKAMYQQL